MSEPTEQKCLRKIRWPGLGVKVCDRTYAQHAKCDETFNGNQLIAEGLRPHTFAFCTLVPIQDFGRYRFKGRKDE